MTEGTGFLDIEAQKWRELSKRAEHFTKGGNVPVSPKPWLLSHRLNTAGIRGKMIRQPTPDTYRYRVDYAEDMGKLIDYVNAQGMEVIEMTPKYALIKEVRK